MQKKDKTTLIQRGITSLQQRNADHQAPVSSQLRQNRSVLYAVIALVVIVGISLLWVTVNMGNRAFSSDASSSSTPLPYASGGLGLTKGEWEKRHTLVDADDRFAYSYDLLKSGRVEAVTYSIDFWRDREHTTSIARISYIGLSPALVISGTVEVGLVSEEAMHKVVLQLLPADAQFLKKYIQGSTQNQGTYREIYKSESLKGVYPPIPDASSPWVSSEPGTIYVTYVHKGLGIRIQAGDISAPKLPAPTPLPRKTPTHISGTPVVPPPNPSAPKAVPNVPMPEHTVVKIQPKP